MVFGQAHKVSDPAKKEAHLRAFTERLFPGRWDSLRPVTAKELKATMLLSLSLEEASAKVRRGPPSDEEEDYALPIWAGVVPLALQTLAPIPDPRNLAEIEPPRHALDFRIG
jgi:hypothetical protein